MKAIVLTCLFCVCTVLGAVTLISQDFTSTTFPPTGWTMTGPSTSVWSRQATNAAGGTTGELRLYYSPDATGTYRFISPVFDTRKVHDMTLTFRHFLDDYPGSAVNYTIGVQISNDGGTSWTSVWSVNTSSDILPTPVTVPISFALGMSVNTKIAFFFEGNNYDIDSWFIDDIVLTYVNTLGSGTWETSSHYPIGNVIIPNGHTLQLNAGTMILFGSDKELTVQGRLLANGTESEPVVFSTLLIRDYWKGIYFDNVNAANDSSFILNAIVELSNDTGIYIDNSDKLRISNSTIRSNSGNAGGGIYCLSSFAIIEGCDLHDNTSTAWGAAIVVSGGTPIVRNNRMYSNSSIGSNGSILHLSACNISGVYNNQISANYLSTASNSFGVRIINALGTFQRNLINNNQAGGLYVYAGSVIFTTVLNCDIAYNGEVGFSNYANTATLKNTIIWGNGGYAISNYQASDHIDISYCCFDAGSTSNVIPTDITYCIDADPLFINPSAGNGISNWSFNLNWGLQPLSPCIDTGDPASPLNPDGSREDIGMYYRLLKPVITRAADFPGDQGHSLDLVWNRNDIDTEYDPNAYYGIWRSGDSRSDDSLVITDPAELTFALLNSGREIIFRDGDRTWYWLNIRVPASLYESYGMIVDTPQDSSSTGTHAFDYKVTFYNQDYFWDSIPVSGYTVDNIPPYAPSGPEITHISGDSFNLSWDEVTEGGWEGNSYPELNLITYKIYSGDTPDFAITPAAYLMSTTNPAVILTNQTASRKFYKIIASDSE